MRRREFITLIGGAAAWPITTYAQQPDRQPRIGVLMTVDDGPGGQARLAAFRQGLQQLGWTDGRNIRIDVRWSAGNDAKIARSGRSSRPRAECHLGYGQFEYGAVDADIRHRADRIRDRSRSGRRRLCQQPGAAGRQRHGLLTFRIQHWREMAGPA